MMQRVIYETNAYYLCQKQSMAVVGYNIPMSWLPCRPFWFWF